MGHLHLSSVDGSWVTYFATFRARKRSVAHPYAKATIICFIMACSSYIRCVSVLQNSAKMIAIAAYNRCKANSMVCDGMLYDKAAGGIEKVMEDYEGCAHIIHPHCQALGIAHARLRPNVSAPTPHRGPPHLNLKAPAPHPNISPPTFLFFFSAKGVRFCCERPPPCRPTRTR